MRADCKLRSKIVTKNPLSRKTLLMISLRPMLLRFAFVAAVGVLPVARSQAVEEPRKPDGDATIVIGGTLKQWHNVTLTCRTGFT